ncbi:YciI family protein [Pseudoroseicyclus tamaricis]|uniref:YCII-related domain-containing protein n=1 Tax=Pseudoroseicyclus tamaricis TaxID=2705421 RepID=A0A6B2JVP4_9RHOB|nr:YciI family protein [Pseudoroseicyclus tamaricis]NDV02577.1 hypothetical protein [Pseudoroseicyclus tamaricis]
MPRFIFTYHGGRHDMTQEEVTDGRQRWMDWMKDLGDRAVEPNNPLKAPEFVGPGKDEITPMMGYSVIEAASAAEAGTLADGCPFLDMGGTIMVAEIVQMD